jgi:type I restriction enzyme, S subunit
VIEGLRPYTDMVETGVDWMPEVPAHWDVRRIKTVLREVDRRTPTGDERLLSLRMIAGLIDHHDAGGKLIPATALVGYKMIEPGQIVMNRMRAASGLFGLAHVAGLVSPDYAVFEESNPVDCQYLLRLFKLPQMSAIFRAESKGLGTGESGFLRLYTDRFGPIPIPLPPLEEQRLIVRFLDWHGGMTARLIRAKKRLIALLNEQKQSIIHHAVTRGLDPATSLKPSGVDWLGDVPEGWEVKPLKHWASINRETLGAPTPPDYSFDYVDISAVGTGFLSAQPEQMEFSKAPSRARRIVSRGDTLISTVRTYLKAIYFVETDWPDLIASTGFAVLAPNAETDPRFFAYALQSPSFINLVILNSDGVAYPAINESRLGSLKIALPPSREEQAAIIEHLEIETASVNRAIALAQQELAFIQEFRTRLIADVVTGQIDVRALAATLPAVTATAPLDQPDDDAFDEEADALEDEEADA